LPARLALGEHRPSCAAEERQRQRTLGQIAHAGLHQPAADNRQAAFTAEDGCPALLGASLHIQLTVKEIILAQHYWPFDGVKRRIRQVRLRSCTAGE